MDSHEFFPGHGIPKADMKKFWYYFRKEGNNKLGGGFFDDFIHGFRQGFEGVINIAKPLLPLVPLIAGLGIAKKGGSIMPMPKEDNKVWMKHMKDKYGKGIWEDLAGIASSVAGVVPSLVNIFGHGICGSKESSDFDGPVINVRAKQPHARKRSIDAIVIPGHREVEKKMNKKADKYDKTVRAQPNTPKKKRDAKVRPADGNVEQVPLNKGKGMIGLPTGKSGMIGLPAGGDVIPRGSGVKRKPSAWMKFVQEVRAKHPSLSYKDAMVKASQKWKKKKK